MNRFYDYLKTETATATMCALELGIPQKNICRYKRHLEKANKLWETKFDRCPVTGFEAWFLTTNPEEQIPDTQLELF
jgi:hypothetical protein